MTDDLSERLEKIRRWLNSEALAERVTRRTVIGAVGSAIIGSQVLPIPWKVDERLRGSERELQNLAREIEDSDLKNPQQIDPLYRELDDAIQSVESVLKANAIRDGRQVAEGLRDFHQTLSSLPGVSSPPEQSRTAQRLSSLNAALQYYKPLRDVLAQVLTLRDTLGDSEQQVLFHTGSPPYWPADRFNTENLHDSIERLGRGGQQSPPRRVGRLLPNQEAVSGELDEQKRVLETHIAVQQAYLETGFNIESGTRYHEQSKLNEAMNAFEAAHSAVRVDVDGSYTAYRLSASGLSLGEYNELFSARLAAIEKLLPACDRSLDDRKRRDLVNQGLDHLLEARRVITVR